LSIVFDPAIFAKGPEKTLNLFPFFIPAFVFVVFGEGGSLKLVCGSLNDPKCRAWRFLDSSDDVQFFFSKFVHGALALIAVSHFCFGIQP